MKIATITFHWANNYGAVLQAYALQQFINQQGIDSEVINYIPFKLYARETLRQIFRRNMDFFKKRKKIREFVRTYVNCSSKTYFNYKQLCKCKYDVVIAGSDQIWNEWFLFHAEKKPCLSYYLKFCPKQCKKIGYAVSFGTEELKAETKKIVLPQLQEFCAIGVRENSGQRILSDLQITNQLVCDPTLLLKREHYESLLHISSKNIVDVFEYIIRGNRETDRVVTKVTEQLGVIRKPQNNVGVCEWLSALNNARLVVTDSFHATVFSLLFHKPFIVMSAHGKKMNDRIHTLLHLVGLEERFYFLHETCDVTRLLNTKINWEYIDEKIEEIRHSSQVWLLKQL